MCYWGVFQIVYSKTRREEIDRKIGILLYKLITKFPLFFFKASLGGQLIPRGRTGFTTGKKIPKIQPVVPTVVVRGTGESSKSYFSLHLEQHSFSGW